jgi:hypothetical protein
MEENKTALRLGIMGALVLAGIVMFGGVMAGSAGTAAPGSQDDPLVTRSFVLEQIEKALSDYKNEDTGSEVPDYFKWQVAELAPGQQFEGMAGTEFIVRAGNAALVDPPGSGVPDITSGTNVRAGKSLALDHQLIIPRSDGRGFICLPGKNVIVMYRGEAVIK